VRRLAPLGCAAPLLLAACAPTPNGDGPRVRLEEAPGDSTAGFSRALEPREWRFPEDHGPHFDYQTEWWYYTGNLDADSGRRLGFQLTFFRRGLSPGAPPAGAGLRTNQIYFAHFALTDATRSSHIASERFSRGAAGLAGATGAPYRVWLEGWEAVAIDDAAERLRVRAASEGASLDLELAAMKPAVGHGDRGLSPKSEAPGNASYYVSLTRMRATGSVTSGGEELTVEGLAWFDHEWSTSALGEGAVGWDWFSLQLDDGRELMYFQIRRRDGSVEPVSGGTLVGAAGETQRLALGEVEIEVQRTWTSPRSGAAYPARWRLAAPRHGLELEVRPLVADQEMDTSFVYWEGAVSVSGSARGRGYVELTGYAASMEGVF
jgi:predicted secreted hydrolase